eukprot:gene790-biopygen917
MVVKSSGGLRSPLADFGGLGGPTGGLLADWRTGGLLVLLATPREGQNCQFSQSVSQFSCHSTRGSEQCQSVQSADFMVGFLADFWRTSGGLLADFWRTLADFWRTGWRTLADWRTWQSTGGLDNRAPGMSYLWRRARRHG